MTKLSVQLSRKECERARKMAREREREYARVRSAIGDPTDGYTVRNVADSPDGAYATDNDSDTGPAYWASRAWLSQLKCQP